MTPTEMLSALQANPVALSIRAPWPYAILFLGKDVENRNWKTHFRGPMLIHQSAWFGHEEIHETIQELAKQNFYTLEHLIQHGSAYNWSFNATMPGDTLKRTGAIIGMAEIIDCVTHSESPWFFGPYGFRLRNAVAFPEPIPCRGALGLFRPDVSLAGLRLPDDHA